MTSVKAVIRRSRPLLDGSCNIRIRIIRDRKTSFFSVGHSVLPNQFNDDLGVVLPSHPNHARLNVLIKTLEVKFMDKILQAETEDFSVSITKIRQEIKPRYVDFFEFAYQYIRRHDNEKQQYTFVKYNIILNKLADCIGASSIKFNDFNYGLLEKFNQYMIDIGNKKNTRKSQIGKLATIYKDATRRKLVDRNNSPFEEFSVGKKEKPKKKRPLTRKEMADIRNLPLEEGTNLWHSRNAVLFGFNFMGMRIGDIVSMRVESVASGTLSYQMKKSNDEFTEIAFSGEASGIIDHYRAGKAPKDYLFPFMDKTKLDSPLHKRLDSCTALINGQLKIIAQMAGIQKTVTTHVFRHTYSQFAKEKGLDNFLQELLGHENAATTEGYKDTLGSERISEINKKVLED